MTAGNVQPIGDIGPGGCVAKPGSRQQAARGDLLPHVDLQSRTTSYSMNCAVAFL